MRRMLSVAAGGVLGIGLSIGRWYALDAYTIRVVFVCAATLAAVGALYTTARARRLQRPYLATPPALATLVLSVSCILIALRITPALLFLWGLNVGVSISVLRRAVKLDRRAAALRRLKGDPGREAKNE